jgi:hypothetical protein
MIFRCDESFILIAIAWKNAEMKENVIYNWNVLLKHREKNIRLTNFLFAKTGNEKETFHLIFKFKI